MYYIALGDFLSACVTPNSAGVANDILLMDRDIFCLAAKCEIISVPSYAAGIYHICAANISYRRYITRSAGTDIIEKPRSLNEVFLEYNPEIDTIHSNLFSG